MKSIRLWLFAQRFNNGPGLFLGKSIFLKHLRDFSHFFVRYFRNLTLLTFAFLGIVLGIAFRGQITTQAHGNRTGGNFSQAGGNDNRGWVWRVA